VEEKDEKRIFAIAKWHPYIFIMRFHLNYHIQRFKRGLFARLALAHPGFISMLPTHAPLKKITPPKKGRGTTLVVFLPGIGDLAEDFIRKGIVDDMRLHGIKADAVAIDAHYGYYARELIFERITHDVIEWGRREGYQQIWLAGVSLGGFGAALYAARHTMHVEGLVLFAPYLGTKKLIDEISEAGSIAQWEPGDIPETDYARFLWAWLKRQHLQQEAALPIYLAYGTGDKFATANRLLSESMPSDRVITLEGGHNWPTWRRLWHLLLPRWKILVK
jgi:pimeloyl-ACP methyl ester carboxylesterase